MCLNILSVWVQDAPPPIPVEKTAHASIRGGVSPSHWIPGSWLIYPDSDWNSCKRSQARQSPGCTSIRHTPLLRGKHIRVEETIVGFPDRGVSLRTDWRGAIVDVFPYPEAFLREMNSRSGDAVHLGARPISVERLPLAMAANPGLDDFSLSSSGTGSEVLSASVSPDGLYAYLRRCALESGDMSVFDVGRFWPSDYLCAQPGTLYTVAVYLQFQHESVLRVFLEQLKSTLAIDAKVYRWTGKDWPDSAPEDSRNCSMALLFSCLSPLVGPMTCKEVLRAVEHYAGWCRKSEGSARPWSTERVTIELIPRSETKQWFGRRVEAFRMCGGEDCLGSGFPCSTSCENKDD